MSHHTLDLHQGSLSDSSFEEHVFSKVVQDPVDVSKSMTAKP